MKIDINLCLIFFALTVHEVFFITSEWGLNEVLLVLFLRFFRGCGF